jgi:hypothetical protein
MSTRFHLSRRTFAIVISAAALAIGVAIPATATAGLAAPAQADLAGTTFNATDGNLTVEPGETDWNTPAPNLTIDCDLASKLPNSNAACFQALGQTVPTADTSFGQGTKSDNANVTLVTGSIPPNKSDLSRFYTGSEFVGGSNFLYLAWERANTPGSANINFEINQNTTPGLTSTTSGPITLNRTAGDLLITFDFSGSGSPTLSLATWTTSGPTSQCVASNSLPCWGNQVVLGGNVADGSVNSTTVNDSVLLPSDPVSLAPGEFGEAAINLTAAGVFPAGTCKAFGSAMMSSRASSSFGAELKDFIAPVPVKISNCGTVNIIKNTDPRGINQDFGYTSTIPDPTTSNPTTPNCTSDSTPSSFTLNDGSATTPNTESCGDVPAGSYTVTEGAEPGNFTLESLTCTAQGAGASGSQHAPGSPQADITVTPDSTVTCTYVNQQHLGAIKITKTGKDKNCTGAGTPTISNGVCTGAGTAQLSGAKFSINSSSTVTTGSDGTVCVDHLPFGTYSVQETQAPNGYAIDDTSAHGVTVNANSTCGDGHEATFSASDTPLTNVTANAHSQVAGATNSTITCVDSSSPPNNIGNSPQGPSDPAGVTANNLKPGTYTCTVVIDP